MIEYKVFPNMLFDVKTLTLFAKDDEETIQHQAEGFTEKVSDLTELERSVLETEGFFPEGAIAPETLQFTRYELSYPTEHQCNLRCKYCFAHHGTTFSGTTRIMDQTVIDRALQFLVEEVGREAHSYRIDFVSGGEPLLQPEIIAYTKQAANRIQEQTGKPCQVWMATNGTLLSENNVRMLDQLQQLVGVSLDGPPEYHNSNRVDANGDGTYETVVKGIRRLQELGNRFTRNVWICTVITPEAPPLATILEHHQALNVNQVQMRIVRPRSEDGSLGASDLNKYRILYSDLVKYLFQKFTNGDLKALEMILNYRDTFGRYLLAVMLREHRFIRCQAGLAKFAITASGDIYPCDSFVGMTDYLLGNLYQGLKNDMIHQFKELRIDQLAPCNKCWARYLCGGLCRNSAVILTGSLKGIDPVLCELSRYLAELALDLVHRIWQNDKVKYAQLVRKIRIKVQGEKKG